MAEDIYFDSLRYKFLATKRHDSWQNTSDEKGKKAMFEAYEKL